MASGRKVVDVTHVGRKGVLSEEHTVRAVFHDFAAFNHKRNECTRSAEMSCHGHKWSVSVYPRGDKNSNKEVEHVSVYLMCNTAKLEGIEVKARYTLRVPSAEKILRGCKAGNVFKRGKGWKDYATRSDVLDPAKGYLVDGNLTIEADIQVYSDKLPAWTPKATLQLDMFKVLDSANETGDVKFQVGNEEFAAHLHILKARAPALAAIADEYSSETSSETSIPIEKVEPSAFRSLLRFVYTDDIFNSAELRREARVLLDVANKFGCKGLKLAAEAELVSSGITVDSAAELVLLGDAKNCALLKEAAVDFFAANAKSVMASPGWVKVTESAPLMKELMEVLVDDKKRPSPGGNAAANERDYKRMCVSDLRRKLDEKGIDVDGSREMLINRLEKGKTDGGYDVSTSSHEGN